MYMLTITCEVYSRTESGKSWRSKPDTAESETLPWYRHGEDVHRKTTSDETLAWFRRIGASEYAERSYTPVGYIVTRLISTSPDRTVRVVRKFRISDTESK